MILPYFLMHFTYRPHQLFETMIKANAVSLVDISDPCSRHIEQHYFGNMLCNHFLLQSVELLFQHLCLHLFFSCIFLVLMVMRDTENAIVILMLMGDKEKRM